MILPPSVFLATNTSLECQGKENGRKKRGNRKKIIVKVISYYNENFYSNSFNFIWQFECLKVMGLVEWVSVGEIIWNTLIDVKPNC